MNQKLYAWILVLVLCVSTAHALGIMPAKSSITVGVLPANYAGSFKVVNNDHTFLTVKIYPEGPLASSVALDAYELTLAPNEEFKTVHFTLNLNENIPPGPVEMRFIVEETAAGGAEFSGGLSAKLKLFHKVLLEIPYPGKYVQAAVDFEEKTEDIEVSTTLKNLGREPIASIQATHQVFTSGDRLLSVSTTQDSLGAAASKTFKNLIDKAAIKKGEYTVKTEVEYDANLLELYETLLVGKPTISVLAVDRVFKAGQINKVTVELLSDWNTEIPGVYADVTILQGGRALTQARTETATLLPAKRAPLVAYLPTQTFREGDYELRLTIYTADQELTETESAAFYSEEEYDQQAPRPVGSQASAVTYLTTALLAIIAIILLMLVYQFRKLGGPGGNQREPSQTTRPTRQNDQEPQGYINRLSRR